MKNENKITEIVRAIKFLNKVDCFNCDKEVSNGYYIYSESVKDIHSEIFKYFNENFKNKSIDLFYTDKYISKNKLLINNTGTNIEIHFELSSIIFYGLFKRMISEMIIEFNFSENTISQNLNDATFFKESVLESKFNHFKPYILFFNGEDYQKELFEKHLEESKKYNLYTNLNS